MINFDDSLVSPNNKMGWLVDTYAKGNHNQGPNLNKGGNQNSGPNPNPLRKHIPGPKLNPAKIRIWSESRIR
jgi:hypothetical protein